MRFSSLFFILDLNGCAVTPPSAEVPGFCLNSADLVDEWKLLSPVPEAAPKLLASLRDHNSLVPLSGGLRPYWLESTDHRLRYCEASACNGYIYTFVRDGAFWKRAPAPDEVIVTADCGGRGHADAIESNKVAHPEAPALAHN